jgi:hypothetical protein
MSGSRGRSGGLPCICGGGSGPNSEQANSGTNAVALAPGWPNGLRLLPSSRQAVVTMLFSSSGLGARHSDQAIAGVSTVPSGPTTSADSVDGSPGRTSGGSARVARMRCSVTSDDGLPKSGLHPATAHSTASSATPLSSAPVLATRFTIGT